MLAGSLLQKIRHHEIRIAEQGRNAHHRSQHLGEERAAAVAQKQVGLFSVDDGANLLQCLLGGQWEVGSQHHRRPLKRLFQGSRHRTAARSEESVWKSIFFILINYCLYLYVANWMDAGLIFVSFLFPYFPMTAIAATYIHNMRHLGDTTFDSYNAFP